MISVDVKLIIVASTPIGVTRDIITFTGISVKTFYIISITLFVNPNKNHDGIPTRSFNPKIITKCRIADKIYKI